MKPLRKIFAILLRASMGATKFWARLTSLSLTPAAGFSLPFLSTGCAGLGLSVWNCWKAGIRGRTVKVTPGVLTS